MILKLPKGTILGIDLVEQECRIQCREGRIWITRSGDRQDHMIGANEEYAWKGTAKIVIEAVRPSCALVQAETALAMNVSDGEAADEDPCHTAPLSPDGCAGRPVCGRFSCEAAGCFPVALSVEPCR